MEQGSLRKQRRAAKLRELVDAHEAGATGLAADIGTPKSHVSAILAGRRGIGDTLAAKIEQVFGKRPGWMDAEDDLVLSDAERALVLAFRAQMAQPAPSVNSPTPQLPTLPLDQPPSRPAAQPPKGKHTPEWEERRAEWQAQKDEWNAWMKDHRAGRKPPRPKPADDH